MTYFRFPQFRVPDGIPNSYIRAEPEPDRFVLRVQRNPRSFRALARSFHPPPAAKIVDLQMAFQIVFQISAGSFRAIPRSFCRALKSQIVQIVEIVQIVSDRFLRSLRSFRSSRSFFRLTEQRLREPIFFRNFGSFPQYNCF